MKRQIAKKRKFGKIVGATIGIILVALVVAGIVCYFKVPAFKTWLTNGWQEFIKLFKKK